MRANSRFALLALAICCWSCEPGPQPKAVVPAAPLPELRPAPVVEPQTVARLPAPQPVPPDSVPPPPPLVEYRPPEKPADPKPAPAPQSTTRSPRRAPVERPAVEGSAPVSPPPEEPKPQTLSALDDSRISREHVAGELDLVQALLKGIENGHESKAAQTAVARIRSFVRLSEQAAARGDLRQADILAARAVALARDLTRPK
jgi:hypothetical protein